MKAIIQAYSPEEVERIARGEQTIKVCKTAPKLETPFKVYVYKKPYAGGAKIINEILNSVYSGGKVIGEFVCDEMIEDKRGENTDVFSKFALLSLDEQKKYGKNKPLYGWHISELKIYDEPKELREFRKPCPYGVSECMYDERPKCYDCDRTITRPPRGWQYVKELI